VNPREPLTPDEEREYRQEVEDGVYGEVGLVHRLLGTLDAERAAGSIVALELQRALHLSEHIDSMAKVTEGMTLTLRPMIEQVIRERDLMHIALEEIAVMLGPEGREQFVMLGPRGFSVVLSIVKTALGALEQS
jgi:hypothetical protein